MGTHTHTHIHTLLHLSMGSRLTPRLMSACARSLRRVFNVLALIVKGRGLSFAYMYVYMNVCMHVIYMRLISACARSLRRVFNVLALIVKGRGLSFAYMCMHVCMYVCALALIIKGMGGCRLPICVCMFACMYVWMFACMYVWMYIRFQRVGPCPYC